MNKKKILNYILSCERISFYCDFYSISVEDLKENPQYALRILKNKENLDDLINGYVDMQNLNTRISNSFSNIERECEEEYEQFLESRFS